MKKIISILLTVALLVTGIVPVFADYQYHTGVTPVIYIRGSGSEIRNSEGKRVWPLNNNLESDTEKDTVMEVVDPYLKNAVLKGEWDAYFDKFASEIGDLFAEAALDENGEATNGTDITPECRNENNYKMTHDCADANGLYSTFTYTFWYDWRTDPMSVADDLNEYINAVLEQTGAEKVSIISRCLGVGFMFAYLSKYGHSKLKGIGINSSVMGAMDVTSDVYSGNITVDDDAAVRFYKDLEYLSVTAPYVSLVGSLVDSGFFINYGEIVDRAVDFLEVSGGLKVTTETIEILANTIYSGLIPRVIMKTVGTWPGYWSTVSTEAYPEAREFIFGDESSDFYQQYKGLIEKLDNFYNNVSLKKEELLKSAADDGVNVGIVSKYGYQGYPFGENCNNLSDQFAGLSNSSFGATTGTNTKKLSSLYVRRQQKNGLGDYISPDNLVDTSTCLFPESTWIIKNCMHDIYRNEIDDLLFDICQADYQITVDNNPLNLSRFSVYHYECETEDGQGSFETMTTENCNTEQWASGTVILYNFRQRIEIIINFFKMLFSKLFPSAEVTA